MNKGTIILICGLPGAGKTTLAKKLEIERNAVRLCADEWIIGVLKSKSDVLEMDRLRDPMEQLLWKLAQRISLIGSTAILENGFWSASERKTYIETARKIGVKIELHFLDTPPQILKERLLERNKNLPDEDFEIDMNKFDEWINVFEAPTDEEMSNFDFSKKYNP